MEGLGGEGKGAGLGRRVQGLTDDGGREIN